jgi:hypothetical protein
MAWRPEWFRLPGQAVFDRQKQQVTAITRTPCHLDLFVIGFDNRVWTTFWTEERGWNQDWFHVPGEAFFDREKQHVTAVSRHHGHLDLYVIGFDNRVWTTFWHEEGGGWHGSWFHVPGNAVFDHETQRVAAVSRHRDQLDLFVIGLDNRVWTTFWSQVGGWHQIWFHVRGPTPFDHTKQHVAAVSRAPGQLDLFAIRSDNRVMTTFWSQGAPDGGWLPHWFPVRGTHVFDHQHQQVAALSRKPGQLDLFAIGFDNRVWTTFWSKDAPEGGWHTDWFPVADQAIFDFQKQRVTAVSRHAHQLDLFVVGPENHVWTMFWTQGRPWHPHWFAVPGLTAVDREKQHVAAVSRSPGHLDLFAIDGEDHVASTFWGQFYEPSGDYVLDEVPADGSPAKAYATHQARAKTIARNFASKNALKLEHQIANEDNAIYLIAHFQAARDKPDFKADGADEISKTLAPKVLRLMHKGHGQVGTHFDDPFFGKRDGDYDMALKGLIVLAYRYRDMLDYVPKDAPELIPKSGLDFILDHLVPPAVKGPHNPFLEWYPLILGVENAPETENHMLMITSTRYLVNQLLHDRPPHDANYDNKTNGTTAWLFEHLQRVARHDFLEFNSRIYQRLSLHALLNLHEFARDEEIRTAAHIVLDYSMAKFAISSNRSRRVNPFRRKKENTNTPYKLNDLVNEVYGNDPLLGFFMAYLGPTDPAGKPLDRLSGEHGLIGVIAGLAPYRPPPAAYALALQRELPPFQHRLYHGNRPILPGTDDQAQGGVEIYYRSPSFLLTAGGGFLNSGYGGDEFTGGAETAIAQSTTLIPTRADVAFSDLIRFDPYFNPRLATNTGVHLGFACGANLRPSDKNAPGSAAAHAPCLAAHRGQLRIAWTGTSFPPTGSLFPMLTVATVRLSSVMLDGVEAIDSRFSPPEATDVPPALESHACRLFLAWNDSVGNETLNLMFSDDGGASFRGKLILQETSDFAPELASHAGRLFMAWTGEDDHITVAKVRLQGSTAGTFAIERLEDKVTLPETSDHSPALVSHNGRLFLAWRGSGEETLNLAFSEDGGATFRGKLTLTEQSDYGPALATHNGRLFIAWTDEANGEVSVARVNLFGSTSGASGIEGLEGKVVLDETSEDSPTLASHAGRLFLGWKGEDDRLNILSSRDGWFYRGPWYFCNLEHLGFYVAVYRTPVALPEQLEDPPESLGFIYAMEAGRELTFQQFERETRERNPTLPAKLDYGGHYQFNAPDGPRFAFWMHPSLQTYQARISLINEPNPVTDFAALPLVEGPYLRAPGGHDGFIEVHDPRCATPLILDYTDTVHPKRIDPRLACAELEVERAEALTDYADHLIAAGKGRYADATLVEQAKVLKKLAEVDSERHGANLGAALQFALGRIGVEFDLAGEDIREWIHGPRFRPSLAISEALLDLLGGRTLRQPVDLEGIINSYEGPPGVRSPHESGEVLYDVLKAALLERHNRRYADDVREFDTLLR